MVLADMLATDEDAIICDLAETYHIYDYKSLPCSRVAIFCIGLRNDSRIKMKMSGMEQPLETILTASIADRLTLLLWSKTKDGVKGRNRPESIAMKLMENSNRDKTMESFNSPEEFEDRRRKIIQKGKGKWRN